MHIFAYNGLGGADHDESNFTRTEASVNNGVATIHRKMYFEADSVAEDSVDVLALAEFPTKHSAHPNHPSYKYYGNASIAPTSTRSKVWVADLEYSTTDPNATDSDGASVTSETKPWKLRPDNIAFTYPEVIVPFRESYDSLGRMYNKDGNAILPVKNSAGDMIAAERSVRNIQMSFTFATLNWDINNAIEYGNSINAEEITICGLTIPAGKALLLPPECSYITVYEDNSTSIKWQYWSVNIVIQIDKTSLLLNRKMLDVGDRAKFPVLDLFGDALLAAAGADTSFIETLNASQICHFRKTIAYDIPGEKDKKKYIPNGELVFCSWGQFISARQLYYEASMELVKSKKMNDIYELQCEQDTQMPLDGSGYLYKNAIEGTPEYVSGTPYMTLTFREYPEMRWDSLNLPKKGIKW